MPDRQPEPWETSASLKAPRAIRALMPRNPPWSTDELVLALDLYHEAGGWLDDTDPRVVDLSRVLNSLPHIAGDPSTFRNANGVSMKLANFLALDPGYSGAGLRAGGKRDEEVFDAWKDRTAKLHELAQSIRRGVATEQLPPDPESDEGRPEGALVLTEHARRERDPRVARQRKQEMIDKEGELRCEICDFNESAAKQRFGLESGDVFECHHRTPLGSLIGSRKTRRADLAVLCPLCHRGLHRVFPMPSVESLRATVSGATSPSA